MTTAYKENETTKTAEITVSGKVTKADFDAIIPKLDAFIEKHGNIRFLEIIKDFDGFEASVLWPGIKFDMTHLKYISHCAVVSDIGWISPMSKAAGAFLSTKLRTFALEEEPAARAWLAEAEDKVG